MRRPGICVSVALVMALALWGCGAPPEKEMAQAREALAAARAAGAERYAAQEYKDAAAAMERSERFVAEHDYRQALSAALDARERADVATRSAAVAKEQARGEAAAVLKDVEAVIGEAHGFVDQATERPPRTRPERLHVSEVRRAIVVANVAVQKAREAMSREEYGAASAALAGVSGRLRAVLAAKPAPPPPVKPKRGR